MEFNSNYTFNRKYAIIKHKCPMSKKQKTANIEGYIWIEWR